VLPQPLIRAKASKIRLASPSISMVFKPPVARLKALPPTGQGEGCGVRSFSQGPISLRITLQVLPAAVSFLQNLSSGARSSSTMAMT